VTGTAVRGPDAVRVVAVVGAGSIGASWAALAASHGLDVVATDPAASAERYLHDTVRARLADLDADVESGAARVRFDPDLERAVSAADLVLEAGPERLDVKHEIYTRLDAATAPDVLLASSSSGLAPSALQEPCRHPERVLVTHPFNPPHLIPLVEVVGGRRTSDEAMDAAMGLMCRLGRSPVRLHKELPGHVVNRLQAALWREAYSLVNEGVVSVADLDRAVSSGPGLRWALLGPFATQHLSGGPGGLAHVLDHLGPPMVDWWADLGAPELTPELCALLVQGVEAEVGGREQDLERRRDQGLRELLASKARLGLDGTEPRAESVEAAP
jgi:carnitine 3-dehydrogenase